MVGIVVAVSENNVIGKDNQLVWHLPADLKHFKNTTMGHPILMGRKTFESIGKPLPGRKSIVITRQEDYKAEGCLIAHTVQEAIEKAKELDDQVYIIGGAEVYKQALPYVDTIELTKIHHSFDGDTYFPAIKDEEWKIEAKEEHFPDDKNKYSYSFITLTRK
jgi:dihydrofolate reductase